MSYCRFSSDNWQSDIYCYEAMDGYCIEVAAYRYNIREEDLPKMEFHPGMSREEINEYVAAQAALNRKLAEVGKTAIGLPYDGQHFMFETLAEVATKLCELNELGYRIPRHLFILLEEERQKCQC